MSSTTEALIKRVLTEHVCVGGTYWDGERKTTFATCQCGARCYLVRTEPSHAAHVAAAITQALAERGEVEPVRECDHPNLDHDEPWSYCWPCPKCGVCKFIGHGPLCLECATVPRESDTTWAEDAAASHRALYDTDSGRLDNRSER